MAYSSIDGQVALLCGLLRQVRRDDMQNARESEQKAMELLMSRGVISRDVTLKDLLSISSELAAISPGDDVSEWTFISPHYVYKGDKVADIGQEVINR